MFFPTRQNLCHFDPEQFALFCELQSEETRFSSKVLSGPLPLPLLVILTLSEAEGEDPRIYVGSGAT